MNLFSTFNDVLNPDVQSRIASYVDEPADKARKAVEGLVYTIVGGLMKRTTSEIGVNQLFNHIQKGHYDGSLTDNLLTVLRDPAHTNTLITQGNDVISHLLPAMKSSIGSMISSYAGIRNSSAISLLGLTSTIVLHVLGKRVNDQKLDANGLASSLFSEREALISAVPDDFMARLIEKVGLQQIVGGLAAPARRTTVEIPVRQPSVQPTRASRPVAVVNRTTATRPAVSYEPDDSGDETSSLVRWGMGSLVVLALAAAGFYVYQNTRKYPDKDKSSVVTTAINDTVRSDTVSRSLAVPSGMTPTAVPTSATVIKAPVAASPAASTSGVAAGLPGTLTRQMAPYIGNAALPAGRLFSLTDVSFQPGSLSMTPGSQATVGELATLLKTYPRLQIQLVGYANDAQGGSTNKSLSFKRVNGIKQQLMASGIDFVRIDAIGRGTGVSQSDTSRIPEPTLRKINLKVVVK